MTDLPKRGRPNQKRRTRKDLLKAAARLMQQGRKPTLEEIADEALVSRATAYRYFPGMDALLAEALLDVAAPDPETLFGETASSDPVERLEQVDSALHDLTLANEASMRLMLSQSLQRGGGDAADLPPRQNRRTPLIEAALRPARKQFTPAGLRNLSNALAMVIGTEAIIVFKDVLQLDDAEARKVKRWAIRALVEAARR
ncbi:MAG TPA: helix-turn-helix domain-containing protein [Dokdonella sp.]|nr:helix-turn-helix domain-containing protein [Dokdonella sp.]